ncbi:BREX-3 system P-loop-containing protein BrxF [Anaerobranca gottschalkii]|uniref:BREX-3 system P-loop-containing protein BrxF n=1 Tax=Anaerobranca gottschalkii TaxID=108328 RepID=UPI000B81E8DB|nr:BREX-3 system P-loop-containing protein BrxF [Anaerobranca gottschalkii]
MSTLIKSFNVNMDLLKKITIPIIFCSLEPRLIKLIDECKYQKLSLNLELSKTLLKKEIHNRTQFVTDEVMEIVNSKHGPIFLIDYEMLFDPRYQIDVIKLFCELSRKTQIIVKWCGTFEDNHLIFATPDYSDYHSYNINNYQIICVN